MKKIALLALLLLASGISFAQSERLDSLISVKNQLNDAIDSLFDWVRDSWADSTITSADRDAAKMYRDSLHEVRGYVWELIEEEKRLIKERRPAPDKILDEIRDLRKEMECPENYKLYPTQNMWTFLKLDTRTGRIWQVQYSVEGSEYRFETVLSYERQVDYDEEWKPGRFELYPTQNMYNFIMIDKVKGGTWQVQWSMKEKNRGIMRIGY